MKKGIFYLFLTNLFFVFGLFGQDSDAEKLINKGDFSNALLYIQNTYAGDTNNANRLYDMYLYFINKDNPKGDSLSALRYAIEYNKHKNKKETIKTDLLAKEALNIVYRKQEVESLNFYINICTDFPQLQNEAIRIRDRLAFEQVEKSGRVEDYENFVALYPNALQVDQARLWLNEHLINEIMESGDLEKLKSFASSTTNDTYKKQALKEIDKLTFRQALKENTIEVYDAYIKEFPNGEYLQMAKNKREAAQYGKYVNGGSIGNMMSFLRENSRTEKNYQLVYDRLKLKAFVQYSIPAMLLLDSIEHRENDIKLFAKRYISDLSLTSIEKIKQAFPSIAGADYITEAEQKAKTITTLLSKTNLSLEDYKKHKSLFINLDEVRTARLFYKFYELNAARPKNKTVDFNLYSDANFLKFIQAEQTDLNMVLTEATKRDENINKVNMRSLGFDFEVKDAYISFDKKEIVFSRASIDGFDSKEGAENKDIYYSVYKNGKWQEPKLITSFINTRYNETNPVLSEDRKTLWFSSDRGLNFGNLDIYVSYREDINDLDSWTEPVLLGEDINTIGNDYVVELRKNTLVLSQDKNFAEENNIYLEGSTDLNFVSGKVNAPNNDFVNLYVCLLENKNYTLINKLAVNNRGVFAYIKPQENCVLYAQKTGYYSPITTENNIVLYHIDELVTNGELITLKSFFEDKNPLELSSLGKAELVHLADIFKNKPYILTMEVHANSTYKKETPLSLSEKQAGFIKNFLVKQGVSETQIITNGVGTQKVVQGWERIDCVDIGFLSK